MPVPAPLTQVMPIPAHPCPPPADPAQPRPACDEKKRMAWEAALMAAALDGQSKARRIAELSNRVQTGPPRPTDAR